MKRLIDAYALLEQFIKMGINAALSGHKISAYDIKELIKEQPTVICVSDDFPSCPKEIRCEDSLCGGDCCEKS